MSNKNKKKRGRPPQATKAEGADWKDAMRHALQKPKPEKGWEKAEGEQANDESPASDA